MSSISFVSLVVLYVLAISSCGGNPQSQFRGKELNSYTADGIPNWLLSAVLSLRKSNSEDSTRVNANYKLDTKRNVNEKTSTLPLILQKEEAGSVKTSHSSISRINQHNSFIRTKRSTCQTRNLPQMVNDLNGHLNSNQYVGLDFQDTLYTFNSVQPTTGPNNATGDSSPTNEPNLRSTCPWRNISLDLDENAFPRYISTAVCLCQKCIGSPSMACKEIERTVTYLYRIGCQNGLALLDTRNVTITVGCHCVAGSPQSGNSPQSK